MTGQQVKNFCVEVREFDSCQVKLFDSLAQVRECDALAQVKVFGTWVEVTDFQCFHAVGQYR